MAKHAFPLIRWTPIREQHLHGDHGVLDGMPNYHAEVLRAGTSCWNVYIYTGDKIMPYEGTDVFAHRMQAIEHAAMRLRSL